MPLAGQGQERAAKIVEATKVLAAKCGQPVGMIVIDTAARAIAGDSQNDSETVMAFVQDRMGAIQRETGAAVMVVHHTNRGGDIRGSLDWRNPMDVVLHWKRETESDGSVTRTCIGEKIKDGPECILFEYSLHEIVLGDDGDGDPITSCVIRSTPAKPKAEPEKDKKPQQAFRAAYNVVRLDSPIAELTYVRDHFMAHYPTHGERDAKKIAAARRQAWKTAIDKLPKGLELYTRNGIEYVRVAGTTDPLDDFEIVDDKHKPLH